MKIQRYKYYINSLNPEPTSCSYHLIALTCIPSWNFSNRLNGVSSAERTSAIEWQSRWIDLITGPHFNEEPGKD